MSRSRSLTRVVITSAGGWAYGKNTIGDDILGALGVDNVAALAGINGIGYLSLEALIALQPALIVVEGLGSERPSLRAQLLQHPVLRDARIRRLEMPMKLWACADAALLDGAQLIADALP
jgi:iron complex transport system substrate-binding protein